MAASAKRRFWNFFFSLFFLYGSLTYGSICMRTLSYNNLYTGRISLYKRIRRGCCSGYFNNNNIPAWPLLLAATTMVISTHSMFTAQDVEVSWES
jgi:hypothetical protein